MFAFKQFVRGPNLNEEGPEDRRDVSNSLHNCNTGEDAKRIYDSIISDESLQQQHASPSTSKNINSSEIKTDFRQPQIKKQKAIKPLNFNGLMRVCESNRYQELEDYLEMGSEPLDLDEQDMYGWTLLMSSACAGATECVEILLRCGASLIVKDKRGMAALDHAKRNRRDGVVQLLENWNPQSIILNDDDEESSEGNSEPIFCEACNQLFSNQNAHIRSIAHLLSAGSVASDGKVHYGIPESNIGFQMLLKSGWDTRKGLGPSGSGQKFPVKTVLKRDREGVGNAKDRNAKRITHFPPFSLEAIGGGSRVEREATVSRREKDRLDRKERSKEITYRRELNSL